IPLFDSAGDPVLGDVTDQVLLWDAGTELNEQPGVGMNQAPRQSGPDTGDADTDDIVRIVDDAFTYPAVNEVIRVTLSETSTTSNDPLIDELAGVTLSQSFPNPFSISTTIPYSLERASAVRISVLDVVGREVAELVDGFVRAGEHTVEWEAQELGTGIYFYRLETEEGSLVRRVVKY
ncbi:MAG: spondin domain-containing protein, partial [Bacteroidota bacterium]